MAEQHRHIFQDMPSSQRRSEACEEQRNSHGFSMSSPGKGTSQLAYLHGEISQSRSLTSSISTVRHCAQELSTKCKRIRRPGNVAFQNGPSSHIFSGSSEEPSSVPQSFPYHSPFKTSSSIEQMQSVSPGGSEGREHSKMRSGRCSTRSSCIRAGASKLMGQAMPWILFLIVNHFAYHGVEAQTPVPCTSSTQCPPGRSCNGYGFCNLCSLSYPTTTCPKGGYCISGPAFNFCQCQKSSGYVQAPLNGTACQDIDECASGTHACDKRAGSVCNNTVGSFTCACKPFYATSYPYSYTTYRYQHTCTALAPCEKNTDNCPSNSTCKSYQLPLCATGVTTGCSTSSTPAYSFDCLCPLGYLGDGYNCTDICSQNLTQCPSEMECNTATRSCACKRGYYFDGQNCTNIDECASGSHNCAKTGVTCTDTVASFTCACNKFYTGNGTSCVAVGPCQTGKNNCSKTLATCTSYEIFGLVNTTTNATSNRSSTAFNNFANTSNVTNASMYAVIDYSFSCKCNRGYEGNGSHCTNIQECTTGTHNCDPNADCSDTIGSFTCKCRGYGFVGNGTYCKRMGPCELGLEECSPLALCTSIPNTTTCTTTSSIPTSLYPPCSGINNLTYNCSCNAGWAGDGFNCTDLDECAAGVDGCSTWSPPATCNNTNGSFMCICPLGYENMVTERGCKDVDECAAKTHDCHRGAKCTNT
jgi:hypothetical protein